MRLSSWEVCKQRLKAMCQESCSGGVGGRLGDLCVPESPPKLETDWLSIWPAGRTSEDTCSGSRVLVIRVVLWTGRETSAHRNICYLERKDSCEISKKMKMEKSIFCKGERGVSLLLGLGWAWVSSSSYFPSRCLSFLLTGWDTYAHCLNFGGPDQAPVSLHR